MTRVFRTAVASVVFALAVLVNPTSAGAADAIRDTQWQLNYLNVDEAHEYSQGVGVTVAVFDTGVDASHPDLAASLVPGFDDANGTNGMEDLDGHGTAMAGLIAANGRALGMAPGAKIQSVRTTVDGQGGNIQPGLEWAMSHGAKVFCIAAAPPDNDTLRGLIEQAIAADIVVVAAAGNLPDNQTVAYPAAYPGVIATAAITRDGKRAEYSTKGPEVVVAAPGDDVGTTNTLFNNGNSYKLSSGTSPAAAIVAGAVALVRSKFPDLSAPEVIHRLTATADDKGPKGRDDEYGYGVINIVKALTADVEPLPTTGAPQTATAQPEPDIRNSGLGILIAGAVLLFLVISAAVTWLIARRT